MRTLPARSVDAEQLAELDKARAALPADSELAETLDYLADAVRAGADVTVVDNEERLTPNRAAKFLGMSRTHLYKLLDAGEIPYVMVGRDRRIGITALQQYQARMEADQADLASRFAHHASRRDALLDQLVEQPQTV
ncbi:excisionase family DNA-binding protein [Rhodococcus sp. NPDC060090]|uniref:excisionase family DNA-binding protein n=1 Tax=Rhodococcus sp. NPDC060090 TaxID=3347056 RepID=UPI00365BB494